MNRRQFLQQTGLAVGAAAVAMASTPGARAAEAKSGEGVWIVCDPADPVASAAPARWAIQKLRRALESRGVAVKQCAAIGDAPAGARCVVAAGGKAAIAGDMKITAPALSESLALVSGHIQNRKVTRACGHDARGLAYALTELADRVDHAEGADGAPAASLDLPRPIVEKSANAVRGVLRTFASDVEDKPWFNDEAFWRRYHAMLAEQRFNRFHLALGLGYDFTRQLRDTYFYFAYPFLVDVPGYDVRASNLPAEERERNLKMLRFASDEAAACGLHFQLGLWTHAYQWTDSPNVNHTIEGLPPGKHAAYCREALRTLLVACPNIAGVTIRIHGESGIAEGSYDFWKTVFDGAAQCGRRVEIDMHAKGMDQGTIDAALATGLPITISPKFWAEHMGLPYHQAWIRPTELPKPGETGKGLFAQSSGSRKFLRYGYGDLLKEDRRYAVLHRIWPGTQRLLLWGDPEIAAAYGRASSFCGSVGVEIFEPLSFKGRKGSGAAGGRDAYADGSLKPAADWEKYAYEYRLWGRLLYNPDAEPDTWQRPLRKRFGRAAAGDVEAALANASRILPLLTTAHLPSAANNNYWPEIYTNMSIIDGAGPYGDTPQPKRFGTVSPLDPQLFCTCDELAAELMADKRGGKYSPAEVAQWLLELSDAAAKHLADAQKTVADANDADFRRLAIDATIQSALGKLFGWKLRAGVLYALYSASGDANALVEALKAYRTARQAWAELALRGKGVYVADITFGPEAFQRGHWLDRLPAIDNDIAALEKAGTVARKDDVSRAIAAVLTPPPRPQFKTEHTPPANFRPGEPLSVELTSAAPSARLYYRHVNQAEAWGLEPMQHEGEKHRATVPADYTESPYPLQYYFELRDGPSAAALYPGFNENRTNQPYFVVRRLRGV